ncbi:beta-L-arabinofuranosidase domain-containing protein [Sphingomonas sp.]|uniref:beta-L-arabinofuranosidase domain-containing protein n=1 Tax=Sphingomonas sp. TaxID=28214 RepID=UPI003B3A76D4
MSFASSVTRRHLLLGSVAAAALSSAELLARGGAVATPLPSTLRPFPLSAVRLRPSPFLDAIEANRRYLIALEPDRLLHNFRKHAGLEPKGAIYGGWESDTIAGHTLGHYLSALALMHAQTGDVECRRRVDYIVDELAACQAASPDGYVAGFTRRRGEVYEDGKRIFPEIMSGDIRSAGFDLNGCWVPFYTWHKLYAGLFDAQTLAGNDKALGIAIALGAYIDHVFAALTDDQVQKVLDCEHGGINESFAELYARTGDARWLRLARRIRHRKVLDPLARRESSLPWIHANTQIPKIIGLARLHELTGDPADAVAARFFWDTVVNDYSYVIGGNADREYFPAPRTVSKHITEQTCESCNTHNMLKLTRHLYAWRPDARLFDYYERAHINHMLAHQDPATGMFAYMVPLASGSHRDWSTPTDDFWCCVGTGIETHSKHGESIWWTGGDMLVANLYIPSTLTWAERGAEIALETRFPFEETVEIRIDRIAKAPRFALALRIPGWTTNAMVAVNGTPVPTLVSDGYAVVRRRWKAGDRVTLTLPMTLWAEPTPDDPQTIALLHGPVVLAADMGPADRPFEGVAPALVSSDLLAAFTPVALASKTFRTQGIGRPADLDFAPFYQQTHRRTAVYFRRFTEPQWAVEQQVYAAEQARLADLQARSVDVMHLGEMQPERDHRLESANSYTTVYRGRHGRDARDDGYFQFRMKVRPGSLVLQATYWGEERNRDFHIFVDGQKIGAQKLDGERPGEFFDVDYPIPETLTRGKAEVTVRFQPAARLARTGPVFGVRIYAAKVQQA